MSSHPASFTRITCPAPSNAICAGRPPAPVRQGGEIDHADLSMTRAARVEEAVIGAHGERHRTRVSLESRNAFAACQPDQVEPVLFVRHVESHAIWRNHESLRPAAEIEGAKHAQPAGIDFQDRARGSCGDVQAVRSGVQGKVMRGRGEWDRAEHPPGHR